MGCLPDIDERTCGNVGPFVISGEVSLCRAASGHARKAVDVAGTAAATVPQAVQEVEEVVPVTMSTWVLLFGITVGR